MRKLPGFFKTLIRFLLMIFIVSSTAGAAGPDYARCRELFSKYDRSPRVIAGSPAPDPRMGARQIAAAEYNQLLGSPVDRAGVNAQLDTLLDRFEKLNSTFPRKQFTAWLEKEAPIERILGSSEADAREMKLGELAERLYQEYFPFLKNVEKRPLKDRVADFSKSLNHPFEKLLERTRREKQIPSEDLKSFVARAAADFKNVTLGGCLSKSDALFKNMLSNAGTGILMFALHGAQNPPQKVADFPWEFFINGLIWSVALDRVACPKLIAREHQLGKEYLESARSQSFLGTVKDRLGKGVVPFLPYYFAGNGTAALGGWLMDRNFREVTPEERPTEDYLFNWAFFNVWDLTYTIPKRVLLLDSEIFTKGFPLLQQGAEHLLKSGLAAKVVRYGSEYATKVAQAEYLHFGVFLKVNSVYEQALPKIKEPVHAVILLPRKVFSEESRIEVEGEGKEPKQN